MKRLATETVGIVNASLQFDAETLTPTYRLLKGVPGRSYGLAIARRLGLAPDVLEIAGRAIPDAERELDRLLAAVEAQARQLEVREEELAERERALREDAAKVGVRGDAVAAREHDVQARARALERDAREQARAYLLEARRKVEEALGRARAAVDEATAREARRLVEQAIAETKGGQADGRTGGQKTFQLGDRVRTGEGAAGILREVRDDGDVVVEVGSVRMVIDPAKLQLLDSPSPSARPAVRLSDVPSASAAATEISLRGLRVDEAEPLLLKALDDAVVADLPFLRIVHGKGTGALRQLVHDVLSADVRVERFGFAPAAQGGHGVTIAELKG